LIRTATTLIQTLDAINLANYVTTP